jgi:hypothetical protein
MERIKNRISRNQAIEGNEVAAMVFDSFIFFLTFLAYQCG